MNISINKISAKQAGFSLVELMVGLVIGLIATVVIMQVFSSFEGQKRSTTGSADAQTNGSIGLYNIEREVQKAGFGLPLFDGDLAEARLGNNTNNYSALRCSNPGFPALPIDLDGDPATPDVVDALFPISIADGVAGASDTITVRYSTPTGGSVPMPTTIVGAGAVANSLQVGNNMGCKFNDIAVVIDHAICRSSRVTSNAAELLDPTKHDVLKLASTAGMTTNGNRLTCIGQTFNVVSFSVVNNELRRGTTPIISEIVDLQAQYGITGPTAAAIKSNQITQWIDAPALTDARRIRAIRVAVVARNNQLEKNAVTTACSAQNAANPTGLCAWAGTAASPEPAINLAAIGGPNYRYRVYEAIIPIRNLAFSGALL